MNYTTSKLSTQTASGFKKLITVVSVSLATLFVVIPTNAEDFWVGGRIKAGTGIYFDRLNDSSVGWGPSQYIVELQAEWSPNNNITVIGDIWLRGDRFYDQDNGAF